MFFLSYYIILTGSIPVKGIDQVRFFEFYLYCELKKLLNLPDYQDFFHLENIYNRYFVIKFFLELK